MIKKGIFLLFLTACSFPQPAGKKNDLNKSLIGWWERHYPQDELVKPMKMTFIEFMDYGECRITFTHFYKEEFRNSTHNSNKWTVDSIVPTDVIISGPFLSGFAVSVISINKTNMVLKMALPDFVDTVYMKKISKLH